MERRSVCLVMIVRNEAEVIRRCLESVIPVIDHWVICDTGSTDDTARVVLETMEGIPGELHEVPWVNFGQTRTQSLTLARGKADYHLLIDADMTLNTPGDFRPALAADAYLVRYSGPLDYWVERVVSDRHSWEYVGPAHEYIRSATSTTRAKLEGVTVTHHGDGGCQRGKIERYLNLLKEGIEKEPENSRYAFYIAESYRDLGNLPQAIEWYEKRACMGGWDEEQWYALYQAARSQHRLGVAWPLVLEAYLRAYAFRPTRIEPLYHVARFYRENEQFQLAELFSRRAIEAGYPEDTLFIDKPIYDYELPLEHARCCHALGRCEEAARICHRVLACPDVPDGAQQTAREMSAILESQLR